MFDSSYHSFASRSHFYPSAAEVCPVVQAPTSSMSPTLPKRHLRKPQPMKEEHVSPLRGTSTRAGERENSGRSTSIVEATPPYLECGEVHSSHSSFFVQDKHFQDCLTPRLIDADSHSVADVNSERKALPTLSAQALIPLPSQSPSPERRIENFPSKQLESQSLDFATNENEMVLSSSSSSEKSSPLASSRSSPGIEIPHRWARKTTRRRKRRCSGVSNSPDPAATSTSPVPPSKRAVPQWLSTSSGLGSPVPSSTALPSLQGITSKIEQSTATYNTSVTLGNQVETGNLGSDPDNASAMQPDEPNFDDILEYIDDPIQHINETDSDMEVGIFFTPRHNKTLS